MNFQISSHCRRTPKIFRFAVAIAIFNLLLSTVIFAETNSPQNSLAASDRAKTASKEKDKTEPAQSATKESADVSASDTDTSEPALLPPYESPKNFDEAKAALELSARAVSEHNEYVKKMTQELAAVASRELPNKSAEELAEIRQEMRPLSQRLSAAKNNLRTVERWFDRARKDWQDIPNPAASSRESAGSDSASAGKEVADVLESALRRLRLDRDTLHLEWKRLTRSQKEVMDKFQKLMWRGWSRASGCDCNPDHRRRQDCYYFNTQNYCDRRPPRDFGCKNSNLGGNCQPLNSRLRDLEDRVRETKIKYDRVEKLVIEIAAAQNLYAANAIAEPEIIRRILRVRFPDADVVNTVLMNVRDLSYALQSAISAKDFADFIAKINS